MKKCDIFLIFTQNIDCSLFQIKSINVKITQKSVTLTLSKCGHLGKFFFIFWFRDPPTQIFAFKKKNKNIFDSFLFSPM